jgi:hypothetical protein
VQEGKGKKKFLEVVEAETRRRTTDSLNSLTMGKERIQRRRTRMPSERC